MQEVWVTRHQSWQHRAAGVGSVMNLRKYIENGFYIERAALSPQSLLATVPYPPPYHVFLHVFSWPNGKQDGTQRVSMGGSRPEIQASHILPL